MSTSDMPTAGPGGLRAERAPRAGLSRRTTETKAAFLTTEFLAYLAVLAAIVIAGAIADDTGAKQVWLYVTILTVGYMVSRGLAKSGSGVPYDEDH